MSTGCGRRAPALIVLEATSGFEITDDDCFGPGRNREDGRALHRVYLFQAKTPAESKQSWDVAKVVATTPADQAWRPLDEGGCPLVKG